MLRSSWLKATYVFLSVYREEESVESSKHREGEATADREFSEAAPTSWGRDRELQEEAGGLQSEDKSAGAWVERNQRECRGTQWEKVSRWSLDRNPRREYAISLVSFVHLLKVNGWRIGNIESVENHGAKAAGTWGGYEEQRGEERTRVYEREERLGVRSAADWSSTEETGGTGDRDR